MCTCMCTQQQIDIAELMAKLRAAALKQGVVKAAHIHITQVCEAPPPPVMFVYFIYILQEIWTRYMCESTSGMCIWYWWWMTKGK